MGTRILSPTWSCAINRPNAIVTHNNNEAVLERARQEAQSLAMRVVRCEILRWLSDDPFPGWVEAKEADDEAAQR